MSMIHRFTNHNMAKASTQQFEKVCLEMEKAFADPFKAKLLSFWKFHSIKFDA